MNEQQLDLLSPSPPACVTGESVCSPVGAGMPAALRGCGRVSDAEGWIHQTSGLLLPRGSVVVDKLDEGQLEALQERCDARGVLAASKAARLVKRSAAEERQLQAFCEWLKAEGLNIFGAVTFTDDYAERYGIYSLNAGLNDVWRGLSNVPMKNGRRAGFRGKFIISGEWHPSGRRVPHVHLALECGSAPMDKVCQELWRYFYGSRGRSRFEPMRDQDVATLYALKDSVKASAHDADSVRFRMWRPKR